MILSRYWLGGRSTEWSTDDAIRFGLRPTDHFECFCQRSDGASRQTARWPLARGPTYYCPRRPQGLRGSWVDRRTDPGVAGQCLGRLWLILIVFANPAGSRRGEDFPWLCHGYSKGRYMELHESL